MKYTSAEASKLIRKLEEEATNLRDMEEKSAVFNAASGENVEDLRPEYDFAATQARLEELYERIRTAKHAVNVFNTTHELPGFEGLTIDQALVYIPQLNKRKDKLRWMAAHLPKERVDSYQLARTNIIDYEVINFDREQVKAAYDATGQTLAKLQLVLDTVNTTETMEIDVETGDL